MGNRLATLTAKLGALSPLDNLARGYGIVTNEDGNAVTKAEQINIGMLLQIQFRDGVATCRAEKVRLGTQDGKSKNHI